MSETKFMPLFNRLKAIMSPLESRLTRLKDEPGDYSLESHTVGPNGRPIWFGGVQVNKRYVSYHLMPVYVHPELLEGLSDGLKKRMQGKSCFNFKRVDEELFEELGELTRAGLKAFKVKGLVE